MPAQSDHLGNTGLPDREWDYKQAKLAVLKSIDRSLESLIEKVYHTRAYLSICGCLSHYYFTSDLSNPSNLPGTRVNRLNRSRSLFAHIFARVYTQFPMAVCTERTLRRGHELAFSLGLLASWNGP